MKTINKRGQALLLVVMLMATVITVVMTVAFKTSTDTQITKLEQESQKGLAAAEAGIEQALATRQTSGTIPINIGDFTGTAVIGTQELTEQFVSPLLQKDQQYTFYTADYDPAQPDPFSNPMKTGVHVYFSNDGRPCTDISLEITLLYGPQGDINVKKYVVDAGDLFGDSSNAGGDLDAESGATFSDGTIFACKTITPVDLDLVSEPRLLVIRPFYYSTRIGIETVDKSALPSQGKLITSDAQSKTGGVQKRVQLFQSYPQIPTDFFVTQF